jgi:hypothetical protein
MTCDDELYTLQLKHQLSSHIADLAIKTGFTVITSKWKKKEIEKYSHNFTQMQALGIETEYDQ